MTDYLQKQTMVKVGEENNYRYVEVTKYRYLRILTKDAKKDSTLTHEQLREIGKKHDVEIVTID